MNQNVILGILAVCGIYWIGFSFIMDVKNRNSWIVFKLIPFFTGLTTLLYAILFYFGVL